jgi:hypothetical protein
MDKINRLGWAAGFSFQALGVRMGVRVSDRSLLPEIERRLPPGARLTTDRLVDHLFSIVVGGGNRNLPLRHFHVMYADSLRVTRTLEKSELLADVERYLEQTLAVSAPDRLFLHAGVVGWRGRAIMLPGASHAGKTTLVAALVRAGATYYSDEYAVLDGQGRVHPYARPLRIRIDGDVVVKEMAAAKLGGRDGERPIPLGLVALLHYRPRAGWRTSSVTPGRAVLDLLGHAPAARLAPERSIRMLRAAVQRALVTKGTRGEAADSVSRLLAVLPERRT